MQYASARAGLVLVNINPSYRPKEMCHALNVVGVRALVMGSRFRSNNFVNMFKELIPGMYALILMFMNVHVYLFMRVYLFA